MATEGSTPPIAGISGASTTGNFADVPKRALTEADFKFIKKWTENKIPENEILNHIEAVHEEIRSKTHVFGCISNYMYLTPLSSFHPHYPTVIEGAKTRTEFKILDLGCCFGQETRNFIVNGVRPNQIAVTDLEDIYWNAGKRLFLDEFVSSERSLAEVNSKFGDWANIISEPLAEDDVLRGWEESFDVVMVWAVLHVLSKEQVDFMLRRIFKALKPGGVVFGMTVGAAVATEWLRTPNGTAQRFLHSQSTLTQAFRDAGFSGQVIVEDPPIPEDVYAENQHFIEMRRKILGDNRASYIFTVHK